MTSSNGFMYGLPIDAKTTGWNAGEQVVPAVSQYHTTDHLLITKKKKRDFTMARSGGHQLNQAVKVGINNIGQHDIMGPLMMQSKVHT